MLLGSEGKWDMDDVGIALGGVSIRDAVAGGQKYCTATDPVVSCQP